MKLLSVLFCLLIISCKPKEKITVKIKPYLPKANQRDALQLGEYTMDAKTLEFTRTLQMDTAFVFSHSFNRYQSLFNKWKRNEIDSISYISRLTKLKERDSFPLSNGYKMSGLAAHPDSILDVEAKIFIGINRSNKKIAVIVDENNNKIFNDDRIVIIDTNNYKTIFDTLQFKVRNLSTFHNNAIVTFQISIMINQLSHSIKPTDFSELFALNLWISASQYFKGKKRINGKRMYFDFKNFMDEYNDSLFSTIVSKSMINRGRRDNTHYRGYYVRINDLMWHIDSFNTRRLYLSINKGTPTSRKLDFSFPKVK